MVPAIKALTIKTGSLENYGSRKYVVVASFQRFDRRGRKYPGRIRWVQRRRKTGTVPAGRLRKMNVLRGTRHSQSQR